MSRLLRIRMLMVIVGMVIVATAATSVFDRWVWSLAVAVAIPAIVALITRPLSIVVRLLLGLASVFGACAAVIAVEGGTPDDFGDAVVSGAQRLLTTEWPSPDRPDLIGAVALYIAAATSLAASLAGQRRWHLVAWLPVLVAYTTSIALSAPRSHHLGWLIPLGLLGAGYAALRPTTGLTERWSTLRGERRVLPLLLIAGLVAGAVSIPLSLAVRADPRRAEPAELSAVLIDPIESTLALRALDPVETLHDISVIDDGASGPALPGRWRTAALSDYDGERWTPSLTLRPIGRRLTPDAESQLAVEISFRNDDLQLIPLSGLPVTVEAPIETDVDRTVVRLIERRSPGDLVSVTAQVAPTLVDAEVNGIATRPIDDSVSSLSTFAEDLAGNEDNIFERLRIIESTMRQEWVLDRNAPGGGLQRALIERFLRDTRRGTEEQFVTAYVLLARSLGVDARVATGFIATTSAVDGRLSLTSQDARIWPEVRLVSGGWAALDPVPDEEAADVTPPLEQPTVQSPAAVQPPVLQTADDTTDTDEIDEIDDESTARTLSSISIWAQRVGVGSGLLLLPLLLLVGLILGLKWRRRRRRLLAALPGARVAGAWAVATDRLVDAGLTIGASATNGDIATAGLPLAAGAERDLRRLAALSSAVTFGIPARPDLLAEDAAGCLARVETTMAGDRTRIQRLKWTLSLRSLRSATRSPVAD